MQCHANYTGVPNVSSTVQTALSGEFHPARRDWLGALKALRRLKADKEDTEQVFRIMTALSGNEDRRGYRRLLGTPEGRRIAAKRVELSERLMDRDWLDGFAPDTVGGIYRAFLDTTGYSAEGLATISQVGAPDTAANDSEAWIGRRARDTHDLWHVLTGYKADEHLGEAALVAFSYAQLSGLGWGVIAVALWFETLSDGLFNNQGRAIVEGYRRGRRASWLLGEDYEQLLAEPLEQARHRLGLAPPARYLAVPEAVRAVGIG